MEQFFRLPQHHINELNEMEISPVKHLQRHMPTRKEAKACDPERIVSQIRLQPKDYLLQYFGKHPGQLAPMRRIIGIMDGKSDSILKMADVLPESLHADKRIFEQAELLNGRNHVEDVMMHMRTASEILLKAGFVYQYVHELMDDHPADFVELMEEMMEFGRTHKHHVHMQDRMAARYITEFLLQTPKSELVPTLEDRDSHDASLVPQRLHRA